MRLYDFPTTEFGFPSDDVATDDANVTAAKAAADVDFELISLAQFDFQVFIVPPLMQPPSGVVGGIPVRGPEQ